MSNGTKYIKVADTAKLIRETIKREFRGVKFSVTSKSYSGGASIRVSWTDGPTTAMVDKVVQQFKGATFDPMVDLKGYVDGELNGERVRFGADYIFTTRRHSIDLATEAARRVARRFGVPMPEILDGYSDAYPNDTGERICGGTETFRDLWWREVSPLARTLDGQFVKVEVRHREYA